MDKKNIKADTETEMTADSFGALTSAMEELKGYKTKSNATIKERADKLKELQDALTSIEE